MLRGALIRLSGQFLSGRLAAAMIDLTVSNWGSTAKQRSDDQPPKIAWLALTMRCVLSGVSPVLLCGQMKFCA